MSLFQFKEFTIIQEVSAMRVGTDAMILGALIESNSKQNCLDIGAGTGVLSLMVAQRNLEIKIQAIEIDSRSAEEAKLNFNNSPWSNRLSLVHSDFRTFYSDNNFDLIISNPPYFENGILNESIRKANSRHEDSLPLIELFQKVESILTSNGHFWLILPYNTASKWESKAKEFNLFCAQKIVIFGKPTLPKRIVFCFTKIGVECIQSSLVIRNNDNSYSEEYKKLTIEFHGIKL